MHLGAHLPAEAVSGSTGSSPQQMSTDTPHSLSSSPAASSCPTSPAAPGFLQNPSREQLCLPHWCMDTSTSTRCSCWLPAALSGEQEELISSCCGKAPAGYTQGLGTQLGAMGLGGEGGVGWSHLHPSRHFGWVRKISCTF